MKKARIALASIALFAVVGGAVAFQANAGERSARGARIYLATTLNAPATITTLNRTISTTGVATYATTSFNQPGQLTLTTVLN
jgi:hypothetical protein